MRVFVESTAGVVASAIDRFGNGPAAAQLGSNSCCTFRRAESFRRYPGDRREDAVKVIGTESSASCHLCKGWRILECFDEPADSRDL